MVETSLSTVSTVCCELSLTYSLDSDMVFWFVYKRPSWFFNGCFMMLLVFLVVHWFQWGFAEYFILNPCSSNKTQQYNNLGCLFCENTSNVTHVTYDLFFQYRKTPAL